MIKYLYFRRTSGDICMIRADILEDMQIISDGTDLKLSFYDMSLKRGDDTEIVLSINENAGAAVMTTISEEIAFGESGFIIVADDQNDVYIQADITAVETTLSTAFD